MTTVALVGDVMLGRGVNAALRTLRPEQPWGDVLPLLVLADLRIINLECALTVHEQPWTRTPKVFHFRADYSVIEVLRAARVDCCSLANNHTLDFEERGLLDTMEHLEAAGVPYAGRLQVFHSIEKTPFLEVEGVIVGQGAAIYASRSKDFDRRVIGTKVEDLRRTRPRLLVNGKGALQVDDAQVSQNQQGQYVAPRLLGAQGT